MTFIAPAVERTARPLADVERSWLRIRFAGHHPRGTDVQGHDIALACT